MHPQTVCRLSVPRAAAPHIRTYVVPVIGPLKVQELTAVRFTAVCEHLLTPGRPGEEDGRSGAEHGTRRACGAAKALADAVVWRLVAEYVAPTRHPSAAGRLDSWQLAAFLASVRNDRFYPLCLMSATTGMRRSELSGLRLGGRGPRPGGRVSVAETRVVVPGQAQDSDGKTVHSRRLLSLDPSTVLALT